MYGAFSGTSFGLVVLAALLVIALAVFASPLLAIVIAAIAAVFLLIGMTVPAAALRAPGSRRGRGTRHALVRPRGPRRRRPRLGRGLAAAAAI
ncbi:MAG: hypothetical protein ACM33U_04385 [Solirubrobacterales bacterium]|nr:hypothetical protein [Solirubrobacterales bacterium]